MEPFIACSLKELHHRQLVEAAKTATFINPTNRPRVERMPVPHVSQPERLALETTKYWGADGIKLSVSFDSDFDTPTKTRVLQHANAWGEFCNVGFTLSAAKNALVRVTRLKNEGYWSYLGTDILHVQQGEPTMNLEGFSNDVSEEEYRRVVRHEFGHTMGFPHEHMRPEIVADLDVSKTLAYFLRTYGWDAETVKSQVLTSLDQSSLFHPEWSPVDPTSIMCYQLPGIITKDGKPIPGGSDIEAKDREFASKVYPLPVKPPPPPVAIDPLARCQLLDSTGKVVASFRRE